MYDGFIYETTCTKNDMKYRGRHRRSHIDPNDPDDSWYIGSPTNPQFWEDLEKYGRDAFVREIIDYGPFDEKLDCMKQETRRLVEVDAAHNPQYYNLSNWGGTKDQNGKNNPMYGRKGILNPNYGKSGPMKGKHHSEETKKKISLSNKGIFPSEETKLKMSKSHEGKPLTESHKKHLSESSAHLSGPSNGMYGKHHSGETKHKIGEAQLGEKNHFYGKHHSEETKKKISEKQKGKKKGPMKVKRSFHLICKNCKEEFLGTCPTSKYCMKCKEKGLV